MAARLNRYTFVIFINLSDWAQPFKSKGDNRQPFIVYREAATDEEAILAHVREFGTEILAAFVEYYRPTINDYSPPGNLRGTVWTEANREQLVREANPEIPEDAEL